MTSNPSPYSRKAIWVVKQTSFYPLTPEHWEDFEALFGERGACAGCWCLYWRQTQSEFERFKGTQNREAMKTIVQSGQVPGILGYVDEQPVGWCALAPRETFSRLGRSRILKKVDESPVWSVPCFFVHKKQRRKGLTVKLLTAAIEYVKKQGGSILEGYPVEPKKDPMPPVFAYTGLASAFLQAGFTECARRSPTRPIMRYYIKPA